MQTIPDDDGGFGAFFDDEPEEEALQKKKLLEDDSDQIALQAPMRSAVDSEKEYTPMFWVFYPEAETVLSKAYAFNQKTCQNHFLLTV